MVDYKFEQKNNVGKLKLITQFGDKFLIDCEKDKSTAYRIGGTAISNVRVVSCKVISVQNGFMTVALNGEIKIKTPFFREALVGGTVAFATEYYHPKADSASLFISAERPSQPELLFVNVDCIDGGGKLIKRYKIDTYTGNYIIQ